MRCYTFLCARENRVVIVLLYVVLRRGSFFPLDLSLIHYNAMVLCGTNATTLSPFLDASSHLYMRVCSSVRPSVRRSVGPSVRRSFGPSVRPLVGRCSKSKQLMAIGLVQYDISYFEVGGLTTPKEIFHETLKFVRFVLIPPQFATDRKCIPLIISHHLNA